MKKRLLLLACVALLLGAVVLPAGADMGPKPSVEVTILGLEGRDCWATLLSESGGTGPHSAIQPGEAMEFSPETGEEEIQAMETFRAYADGQGEGLDFLVWAADASAGNFRWGYYPPDTFRIALWFPEEDALVLSGTCERYAFDSYYTLDLTGVELEAGGAVTGLQARQSYDHVWQGISLAVRFALTVAVEYAIAWLIGLRSTRQQAVILAVNLVTQLALNAGLNWTVYMDGTGQLFLRYALMEVCVFAAEALVYARFLPTPGRQGRDRSALVLGYGAGANLVSLLLGWVLAYAIPGIF